MFYTANWVDSFPENFQWSNATLVTKGMAPYGAVALALDHVTTAARLADWVDRQHV